MPAPRKVRRPCVHPTPIRYLTLSSLAIGVERRKPVASGQTIPLLAQSVAALVTLAQRLRNHRLTLDSPSQASALLPQQNRHGNLAHRPTKTYTSKRLLRH